MILVRNCDSTSMDHVSEIFFCGFRSAIYVTLFLLGLVLCQTLSESIRAIALELQRTEHPDNSETRPIG